MLQQLRIQNYAIIENIVISFSEHLNIITGETGAGKSILVGALGLILGERADTAALLANDKKCFVEGYFNIAGQLQVQEFLKAIDLDEASDELVIRREIAPSGKSRGFINDTPATLQQLKQLSSLLVDLHQQFDTLEVGDAGFQRQVIDALAGNGRLLQQYQQLYKQWLDNKHALEQLELQKNNFTKELDFFQFLHQELEDASFEENELEKAEQELQLLSHAENIKTALAQTYFDLRENERPIIVQLKQMVTQLQPFSAYHSSLPALIERLKSTQLELQDIAQETEHLNEEVQYDASRIDVLNQRLALGYRLLKKHHVQTTNELLNIKKELEEKLKAVLNIEEAIAGKLSAVKQSKEAAGKIAHELSEKRKAQLAGFESAVNQLLKQVGMPNAALKVQLTLTELQPDGHDEIEFLFDANKSNRFEPVRKVASGGELSRLMLCIKSLVAASIELPTMIFDEIDTGISGEAAKQVAQIMKSLAIQRQLIAITHQPQIAGKANAHFFVYKELKGDKVQTNIRRLSEEERIVTIAQMLGGEKPTAAALENAREMIMG